MSEPHATELAQLRDARIYVAGHQGMVGSAIVRRLGLAGCDSLLVRSRSELDLTNQQQVRDFMFAEQPEYVFLAAARVGGIQANSTYPADFIYDNLMIAANVINAAHAADVRRLLFLGSSCIYPKLAPQPMGEDAILTGTLEPTNEPYAIAKIAGIKLCESFNRQYETDFRSVMPTNLYGPNDNFELETSHVVPALIRKFHEGKESNVHTVEIWGRRSLSLPSWLEKSSDSPARSASIPITRTVRHASCWISLRLPSSVGRRLSLFAKDSRKPIAGIWRIDSRSAGIATREFALSTPPMRLKRVPYYNADQLLVVRFARVPSENLHRVPACE
jgi:hypothetical protein